MQEKAIFQDLTLMFDPYVYSEKTKSSLQKIINSSLSDHNIICIGISKIDELKLKNSPVYDMYISDKKFYGELINKI